MIIKCLKLRDHIHFIISSYLPTPDYTQRLLSEVPWSNPDRGLKYSVTSLVLDALSVDTAAGFSNPSPETLTFS